MKHMHHILLPLFFLTAIASAQQEAIPHSIKDLRVLSPEWVCAVVDPTAEILAAREANFGPALAADREKYDAAGTNAWQWRFSKTFRTLCAMKSYHLPLFARFNQPDFWTVNGKTPSDVTVWSQSVDGFPGMDANDLPACDTSDWSRTVDMVYLKLPTPLKPGETLEVKGADGRAASLTFNPDSTPCWSIKVNQSAYAADATKKLAYLGMWLPGIGPVDFSALDGKPFLLRNFESGGRWDLGSATGEPVFAGEIALRKKFADQQVKREGGSNLTGEDVYELDFSDFQGEGTFCIEIPGLGRSWPFQVTADGYAAAFFTAMKGLYIQRCGTELKKPFTGWERPACHTETKVGTFIPETNNWYAKKYRMGAPNEDSTGFRDAAGQRIGLSQFTLIANSDPAAPVLSGAKGGWHDAADFDRRIFHYNAIWDLLGAAEAFPGHFPDDQLNIPESGNGIPDILDEAAWGVDVWKSTQRPDGAVSSWIEQESHPGATPNNLAKAFLEDQMPMFASTPDRAGSYAYAAAAASLGRLLAPYSEERSREYIASAERAYTWALDPAHAMTGREFAIGKAPRDSALKDSTIRFDEDPEITEADPGYVEASLAAASLFLATQNDKYLQDWNTSGFAKKAGGKFGQSINAARAIPILLGKGLPAEDVDTIKKSILAAADSLMASQQANPYRMAWLSPDEGWFHAMAWGNIHAKTRLLAAAFASTGDPKYKASLQNAADFFLGCNPMGSTMMTGIGSVSPVVIQHIHSMSDGIAEPTPGIAPYTLTFGVPMNPFYVAHRGHPSVKSFYEPVAMAFIPDKLGRKEIQARLDAAAKDPDSDAWIRPAGQETRDAVWSNFPVLRRKVIHPSAAVDQNEFTVNETISPLALLFGALTADGWTPGDTLTKREPKTSVADLPIYPMP